MRTTRLGIYRVKQIIERATTKGKSLEWAHLVGANLEKAHLPSPTMILLADWGKFNDADTEILMRLDASAHPDPGAFDRWANGDKCPYNGVLIQRVANFDEDRTLWKAGTPPTIWEAMCIVLDAK